MGKPTAQHPYGKAWPSMPKEELGELAQNIKEHGLLDPVVLYEGMILDGWHRAQACQMVGVKIRTRQFDPETEGDPGEFSKMRNGLRRHMTPAMRAAGMLAVEDVRRQRDGGIGVTQQKIAEDAGVSRQTVTHIQTARRGGLGDAVASGRMKPSAAAKAVKKSDAPEKPARKERALGKKSAEIVKLKADIGDLEDRLTEATIELEAYMGASTEVEVQKKKFELLYREIDGLKSQRDEHMQRAAMWQKEALALRKKLGYK